MVKSPESECSRRVSASSITQPKQNKKPRPPQRDLFRYQPVSRRPVFRVLMMFTVGLQSWCNLDPNTRTWEFRANPSRCALKEGAERRTWVSLPEDGIKRAAMIQSSKPLTTGEHKGPTGVESAIRSRPSCRSVSRDEQGCRFTKL